MFVASAMRAKADTELAPGEEKVGVTLNIVFELR